MVPDMPRLWPGMFSCFRTVLDCAWASRPCVTHVPRLLVFVGPSQLVKTAPTCTAAATANMEVSSQDRRY